MDQSHTSRGSSLRFAVILTTASSSLIPLVGLVTAPLLARTLSPDGRGEMAAAIAPAMLMLAVATLGLPESLTYHLAKRPHLTRQALAWSLLLTLSVGVATVGATWLAVPFLSDGDHGLADLILLASGVTVPALVVNVLRGAAIGHQLWRTAALERAIVTFWRLGWIVGLFVTDELTVSTAVLVVVTAPFIGGVVYIPMVSRRYHAPTPANYASENQVPLAAPVLRPLVTFGAQVWFGAVAMMLLARASQLLMVPLSSPRDLGLLVVALQFADVPLLLAFAIQGALFGVGSNVRNASQTTTTSRLTLLVAIVGCSLLAALLPFVIAPLFGSEFSAALVPAWVLLLNVLVLIPGLMAGSGLAAWGRPGLRSVGLVLTLVINLTAFTILVPRFGVVGACFGSLLTSSTQTTFMLFFARRVLGVRSRDYVLIRVSDLRRVGRELGVMAVRLCPRRPRG